MLRSLDDSIALAYSERFISILKSCVSDTHIKVVYLPPVGNTGAQLSHSLVTIVAGAVSARNPPIEVPKRFAPVPAPSRDRESGAEGEAREGGKQRERKSEFADLA